VLEVAVGTGLAFAQIVRRNPSGRNVGIDLSEGMLAKAQKRLARAGLSNFELSTGSALSIDQQDGSFDVVLNNYMFDLLDESDWEKVIDEFYRVLKPGGKLVLVNMTAGERPGSGLYDRIYNVSPKLMGGCRGVRMTDSLLQYGFSVQRREYYQQFLFPSEVIVATRPVVRTVEVQPTGSVVSLPAPAGR